MRVLSDCKFGKFFTRDDSLIDTNPPDITSEITTKISRSRTNFKDVSIHVGAIKFFTHCNKLSVHKKLYFVIPDNDCSDMPFAVTNINFAANGTNKANVKNQLIISKE